MPVLPIVRDYLFIIGQKAKNVISVAINYKATDNGPIYIIYNKKVIVI